MTPCLRKPAKPSLGQAVLGALVVIPLFITGCARSGPPTPGFLLQAQSSLSQATEAYLAGDSRRATIELSRARSLSQRSGQAPLLARIELAQCAAQVASLYWQPCVAFAPLARDSGIEEQAYHRYLLGSLTPADLRLLPAVHQPVARALLEKPADASKVIAQINAVEQPLSRLVAFSVLLRSGWPVESLWPSAVKTAERQGWRRPLLAWLELGITNSRSQGNEDMAQQLARQRDRILGTKSQNQ